MYYTCYFCKFYRRIDHFCEWRNKEVSPSNVCWDYKYEEE